jgi:hypothetical protein
MATIETILRDETGNIIKTRIYELGGNEDLLSIESNIEAIRPKILGEITHDLLEIHQIEFKKNGSSE